MAGTIEVDLNGDYHDTKTYRDASPERRKQINRYKKENNIENDHMFMLLFQKDLDRVPESEVKKSDTSTNMLLVVGVLLFLGSMQSVATAQGAQSLFLAIAGIIAFILVLVVYFTGVLNPVKRARRKLKKLLSEKPEVPDFDEWDREHPNREDRRAAKAAQKRKRR